MGSRLLVLLAGLGLVQLVAQHAVAAAVAYAPNARRTSPPDLFAIPSALRERGAFRFRTDGAATNLAAWVIEPKREPKGTIVLLHGVRMDKRSLAPLGSAFSDAGFRAVLVDLPGHGESSGEYLTYGSAEADAVSRLLDQLSRRSPLGRLGVYGFSYGGAVALELSARDDRVRAVVAVSTFSSLREVVNDYRRAYLPRLLQWLPYAWFQRAVDRAGELAGFDPDRASPASAARTTRAELLLIHGAADTQVPLEHSERIGRAAPGHSKLVVIPLATHDRMPADPDGSIRREASEWFDRWLASDMS